LIGAIAPVAAFAAARFAAAVTNQQAAPAGSNSALKRKAVVIQRAGSADHRQAATV